MSTTVAVGDDMAKRKRRFHNSAPRGDEAASSGQDALKAEFGRRLQHALTEKGWNQSDLAREATRHMPGKQTFGRDNISNYVRGKQVPGPVRLKAICTALGMKSDDLLPRGAVATVDDVNAPLEMKSVGEGRVFLRVNQVVPMDVAMRIIAMLGQADVVKDGQ